MKLPRNKSGHDRIDVIALAMVGVMIALLSVMLARTAQLQLNPDERLAGPVQRRIRAAQSPGIRGELYDRRGRLLSTTRFGNRVFIDPVNLPDPPDVVVGSLADVLDLPADELGQRILTRLAENDRRQAVIDEAAPDEQRPVKKGLSGAIDAITSAWESKQTERKPLPPDAKPLIRYVPIGGVIDDDIAARVREMRIPGVHIERTPVREYPGGEAVASIVGKVGFGDVGLLGAERALDDRLQADTVSTRYVPDARGRPLWIEPGDWRPTQRGEAAALSIDLELQQMAWNELRRGVIDADASGGRLVLMDPHTGEVLAMVDFILDRMDLTPIPWADAELPKDQLPRWPWTDDRAQPRFDTIKPDEGRHVHPALARNRCVEDIYEPGSTFKPFMWATVLNHGLIELDEIIDTESGRWHTAYGRYIEDVVKRNEMTWRDVLVNSSNIGMTKGTERATPAQLHDAIRRCGFGRRTGIGLQGEAAGLVTPLSRWTKYTHTSVAFGYEVAVTPVQMARAFSLFARSGDLAGTIPQVRLDAAVPGERRRQIIERALPSEAVIAAREPMTMVAQNMEAKLQRTTEETGWRYRIFGKSGTARIALSDPPKGMRRPKGAPGYIQRQYCSSFVAAGPTEAPRLVVVVVIDDPGPEQVRTRTHYGSSVAGPVARRVLERGLTYLGVPSDAVSDGDQIASVHP